VSGKIRQPWFVLFAAIFLRPKHVISLRRGQKDFKFCFFCTFCICLWLYTFTNKVTNSLWSVSKRWFMAKYPSCAKVCPINLFAKSRIDNSVGPTSDFFVSIKMLIERLRRHKRARSSTQQLRDAAKFLACYVAPSFVRIASIVVNPACSPRNARAHQLPNTNQHRLYSLREAGPITVGWTSSP